MKPWWWKLRHRKSRRETVAFVQGMRVGRHLCVSEEAIAEIRAALEEDYRVDGT